MIEGHEARTPAEAAIRAMIDTAHDVYTGVENGKQTKVIHHAASLTGALTGAPVVQLGRSAQFIWDASHRIEAPKNIFDWMHGLINGTIKPPKN